MSSDPNRIIHSFLSLERESRNASNFQELAFVISNLTKQLLPFTQVIVWQKSAYSINVRSISAIANINKKSPYITWLEGELLPWLAKQSSEAPTTLTKKLVPENIEQEWDDHLPGEQLYSYEIKTFNNTELLGGIIFVLSAPWQESQVIIGQELLMHYRHCWQRLEQQARKKKLDKQWLKQKKNKIKASIVCLIFLSLFIPVSQTIITPAKIEPKDPILISSSIEGIINTIYVHPNQRVKKDQILFSLDKITLKNEVKQAYKETSIARERYRRAYQHAYNNPDSKAELAILQAEIEKAEGALKYKKEILARSDIRAPHAGIIIFSSPKYWLGKPIAIGEQVMVLAEEAKKQLDVEVPQADMIQLSKGNKVKFYPNVSPLSPIEASINYASYVATTSTDGELHYFVACDFQKDKKLPRFGSQGSAKIYGDKVSLFFYLFRRPIIYIQSLIGI